MGLKKHELSVDSMTFSSLNGAGKAVEKQESIPIDAARSMDFGICGFGNKKHIFPN